MINSHNKIKVSPWTEKILQSQQKKNSQLKLINKREKFLQGLLKTLDS